MRKARPERFRISLRDETGGTPLPLPSRRMWPIGIFFGVAFLIFAGIAWSQIDSMRGHQVRSVFDLVFILFQGFWVVGWSVGVFVLGALSVLLLFYSESALQPICTPTAKSTPGKPALMPVGADFRFLLTMVQ